jgi:hypothetical protein
MSDQLQPVTQAQTQTQTQSQTSAQPQSQAQPSAPSLTSLLAEATNIAKDKDKEKEETKSFAFRALDPVLHTTWKTCAAMSGISMEEFGIAAIKEHIKKTLIGNKI